MIVEYMEVRKSYDSVQSSVKVITEDEHDRFTFTVICLMANLLTRASGEIGRRARLRI